ncbi:MAG: TauD/TfdA family dioxygenase [Burkholderiales bacterium]|jgi:hypothetical protein
MTPTRQPAGSRTAWIGRDLRDRPETWTLHLDAADNAELRAALEVARARGASIPGLSKADFPLPGLAPRLAAMLDEIMDGRGFTLVRGFEIDRLKVEDAALVYWGLGAHLGAGRAQNAQGDLLGHVTDLGVDYRTDNTVRGYQTRLVLPFHNDATDVVGLMCLQTARRGGLSRIVSSHAVHDALLASRPDLLEALYQPFWIDRRGESPEGKPPCYPAPFFERCGGRLFARYNRSYAESGQRFPDVPRLTDAQRAAMDAVDALCADPDMHLDMTLEPGDMQFICNTSTLHSRTAYEDWPERERRRYLLRLWLDTGRVTELPASYVDRYEDMTIWQRTPRPPVFDLSMRRAELAH